jgi:hypothetical protein
MANQIFASKQPCLRPPRWSHPQVRGMEMSQLSRITRVGYATDSGYRWTSADSASVRRLRTSVSTRLVPTYAAESEHHGQVQPDDILGELVGRRRADH